MYGLKTDVDLSPLKHKRLIQICFGAHDLILNFEDEYSILVTSTIRLRFDKIETYLEANDFSSMATALMSIVNCQITDVCVVDSQTLKLVFSGASISLELVDDCANYESFTISGPDLRVVV